MKVIGKISSTSFRGFYAPYMQGYEYFLKNISNYKWDSQTAVWNFDIYFK